MLEVKGTAKAMAWFVMASLIVAVAFSSLNQPGGPAKEFNAIVETSGFRPSEYSLSNNTANVRLPDGNVVQARVMSASIPVVGKTVKVVELKRMLTGRPVYQVVGPGS